jgi:hypothetical protein
MVTTWNGDTQIEDLRNHPEETVMTLRDLLAGGAKIVPDPKRSGFYEVGSASLVYYIYVSPASGRITLLATWPSEDALANTHEAA